MQIAGGQRGCAVMVCDRALPWIHGRHQNSRAMHAWRRERCNAAQRPLRLKNCTARSCFSAASRVEKVRRLRRLPVLGSILRE
jgi:hypothetical protein